MERGTHSTLNVVPSGGQHHPEDDKNTGIVLSDCKKTERKNRKIQKILKKILSKENNIDKNSKSQ